MRLLLDTNALLWAVHDPSSLSARARALIESGEQELFVSAVSAVEISIKSRLGRLPAVGLPVSAYFEWALPRLDARALPFSVEHGAEVVHLPRHHKDPFDWMLMAQSRVEGIPIVTNDSKMPLYDVELIW